MADPKGFLKTPRQDCARRRVRERVQDWNEVYDRRSLLPMMTASAGCCGTAFPSSGWKSAIWTGGWGRCAPRGPVSGPVPR